MSREEHSNSVGPNNSPRDHPKMGAASGCPQTDGRTVGRLKRSTVTVQCGFTVCSSSSITSPHPHGRFSPTDQLLLLSNMWNPNRYLPRRRMPSLTAPLYLKHLERSSHPRRQLDRLALRSPTAGRPSGGLLRVSDKPPRSLVRLHLRLLRPWLAEDF